MSKTIWLQGGFGNILFQLVPALRIGQKNVYLSTYLTKKNSISYFLGWKIHSDEYTNFFLKSKFNFNIIRVNRFLAFIHIFFGFISKKLKTPFLGYIYFNKNIQQNNIYNNSHYFGYFQNKIYLENHRKQLSQISNQLQSVYSNKDLSVKCAVHFRYGDSIWAKKNFTYYEKVKSKLLNKKYLITIVTDSKDEAYNFFKDLKNFKIVSGEVIRDFSILISSDILYCAPSTFSWWAANCSKAKDIFMPKQLEIKLGIYNSKIKVFD